MSRVAEIETEAGSPASPPETNLNGIRFFIVVGVLFLISVIGVFALLLSEHDSGVDAARLTLLAQARAVDHQAGRLALLIRAIDSGDIRANSDEVGAQFEALRRAADQIERFVSGGRADASPDFRVSLGEVVATISNTETLIRAVTEGKGAVETLAFVDNRLAAIYDRTAALMALAESDNVAALAAHAASIDRLYHALAILIGTMALTVAVFVFSLIRQIAETNRARRRLETMADDLRAAADAAEAGNRAKSAFLATMSHEIRTPINGILGMTDLMMDTRLDADQRGLAANIEACGRGLIDIINDILDFSKLEAGSFDIDRVVFDAVATAESAIAVVEMRVREKGVTLVLAPEVPFPARYLGDAARVRQVMLNFLSNAVKFTEIGTIVVRIQEIARGERPILRFEVQDTGVGISEEGKARLFKEFSQVDASITRRFGGTGLGLAICRRIVEGLGGRVGVESVEGEGSLFYFELPLERAADAANVAPPLAGCAFAAEGRTAGETMAIRSAFRYLGARPAVSGDRPAFAVRVDVEAPENVRATIAITPGEGCPCEGGDHRPRQLNTLSPGTVCQCLRERDTGPTNRAAIANQRRLEVLVVEDNRVNQEVAVRMLKRMGNTVSVAENGAEALAMVNARDFDIVFMDMQMPVMDGLEATRAIRRSNAHGRGVPIVAMTANAFAADREECLAAGMNDFLTKPIERAAVAAVLDRMTGGKGEGEPAEPAVAAKVTETGDGVNRQRVRALVRELGAEDTLFLLTQFLGDASSLLTELSEALGQGDHDTAKRALHTLKGSAANVGFEDLSRQAFALMGQLPDPDIGALSQLMVSIAAAGGVVDELKRSEFAEGASAAA